MRFIGLDIGGANLKFAIVDGEVGQFEMPIWQDKRQLPRLLENLKTKVSGPVCAGVTMTAELADCFEDRQQGVAFIVESVAKSLGDWSPLFYRTDGTMAAAQQAVDDWSRVAASNWHALARMAFDRADQRSGFVFDIGSTSTDIIPVIDGQPVIPSQNDFERLKNRQLFYAGVGRTPVCGLLDNVILDSEPVSIAREFFATARDAFLWLGQLPEQPHCRNTADGRPATKPCAGQRLAKMVCSDLSDLSESNIDAIAIQTKQSLLDGLSSCLTFNLKQHPEVPLVFQLFGSGAWLAEEVIANTLMPEQSAQATITRCSDDEVVNQTAPALAVAIARKHHRTHENVCLH